MKNLIVSVVVPVYNCEKYVSRCIKSIINQTYRNLEIIIINDGSTDGSLKICNILKEKDNRVRIVDQKNSGVSKTRNVGISSAKGDYLMFVDSDDFIGETYIEDMLNAINENNCNVAISGMTFCDEKENIIKEEVYLGQTKCISFKDMIEDFFSSSYFCSACKTLVKLDIINNKNLRFNTELKYGEDYLFTYNLLNSIDKFCYVNVKDYYYRQNNSSATHIITMKSLEEYLENNKCVFGYFLKDSNENLINTRLISKFNTSLRKVCTITNINYKQYKNYKNKLSNILGYKKIRNDFKLKYIKKESFINKILIILLYFNFNFLYYTLNRIVIRIKKR